ncbi:MAG: hypothetical protein Q7S40_18920 [Opitutaceae bacterium]|nr:hypothetical protein [Opitutaceae bacterium]
MLPEKPLVYLVLGASGSGRREVLVDLIEDGLGEGTHPAVMVAETEAASAADVRLPGLARWVWQDGAIVGTLPEDATHVFLVADGGRNPVDQAEVFKPWVQAQGGEIGRVLCVINCQLAEKHPPLLAWYEACVHFADVVLLNRREGVANKWLSEFQNHFKKLYYPCLFEFVKEGRVRNPALVLIPEARRMSQAFDEEQDLIFRNAEGEEIDEEDEEEEDEIEAVPAEDPYFERRMGGRRVKEIPDIAKFLDAEKSVAPPPKK